MCPWSLRLLALWEGALAIGKPEQGPLKLGHKAGRPWSLELKGDFLSVCGGLEI